MFAFTIAPRAMNGSAASSGPSLIRAIPSASSIASSGACRTAAASATISSRRSSAAPFTAPSPVNANWLAYVPEKPAWELNQVSCPRRTFTCSGGQPRMSATTCDAVVSWPCPCGTVPSVTTTSPKMSSFTDAASLFPENWSSGFKSVDCPKLFVPESRRRADAEAEQLPALRGLLPPVLDRAVVDEVERDVERGRVVARSRRRSRSASRTASARLLRSCASARRRGRDRARSATMSTIRSVSHRCCIRE